MNLTRAHVLRNGSEVQFTGHGLQDGNEELGRLVLEGGFFCSLKEERGELDLLWHLPDRSSS